MWNFVWIDINSSLQTNDLMSIDSACDSPLTRLEKILDDSDSKGLWLYLHSD